jgi:hypothetical protein
LYSYRVSHNTWHFKRGLSGLGRRNKTNKTEIAFSPYTRENPRLLSTYKTYRSNSKQDKTAGLRPGRTIVKQDWDTTAGLWPDKTGTRLPAYGRTRLLAYGQTRLLGKTVLQNYAGHRINIRINSRRFASRRRKPTRILTRRKSTQILMQREHTTTRLATMTKFAINYLTSNHDEIRNN